MNKRPTGNQAGIASLVLLTMIVFSILILWEINEYVQTHTTGLGAASKSPQPNPSGPPICLTGERDNCNDSNDLFLLP